MTKHEFLEELKRGLSRLSEQERDASVAYWSEMLEDRIESGMSEEEAVADVGDPAELAREILMEQSLPTLIKSKYKPKRALRVWEIVLLALGSPIWLSVGIAVVAVILAVYAALWTVVVTLWSLVPAALALGVKEIAVGIPMLAAPQASALLYFGLGLLLFALAVFLFIGCRYLTAWVAKLSIWILRAVKRAVIGKGKRYEEGK